MLTHELYTLAARDAGYRDITHAWMARSRSILERHFDPTTARIVDALIEGLSIHRALDNERHDETVVATAVELITAAHVGHEGRSAPVGCRSELRDLAMTDASPTTPTPADPRAGLIALTVTAILWGTIGIVVRLLQNTGMSSASIAFWRWTCACLVTLPILGRTGLRALRVALRQPARLLVVAVGSVAFQLLYFFAVRDVGAGVATLVTLGVAPVALHLTDAMTDRAVPPPRTLGVLLSRWAVWLWSPWATMTSPSPRDPCWGWPNPCCPGWRSPPAPRGVDRCRPGCRRWRSPWPPARSAW